MSERKPLFKPVAPKVDFPALERDTLAWWLERDMMKKYIRRNEGSPKRFSFIDGPITANNPMGVHHAWGRTYKDLYQRLKTMQGYRQRYQNGFDGQGLWIEVEVEKELGFSSKKDIEDFGIDRFVELCKERVRRFSRVQTEQSIRLGYWMDWDNSYHTMSDENNYTIWMFLKRCHERGWIYQGTDVMPWCPRCGTGLSEHEIVTEGYQEIVHPGLYLRFPLLREGWETGEALLVWTTTPWTLTSNSAAAVHPELTYVKVRARRPEGDGEEVLYLAKSRLVILQTEYQVLEEMAGSRLVGLEYRGPFDELPAQEGNRHTVIPWKEVSEAEGTGVVHIAPGCGREDFALGQEHGLRTIAPLDEAGVFVEGFGPMTGRSVFEVNDTIYDSLRAKGLLYRLEDYIHRYPVCWRCGTELVFRLVDEWFISMEELRHRISDVARRIRWVPSFGLERELDWLRNMDDWMISKKRYWGLALPIYKCDCGHFEVIGSEQELRERAVEGWEQFEGHSPHRPWIDAVKILCPQCGRKVSRIKDVGNPWLDAGIVAYSTLNYRHDRRYWSQWFPADFICESFPGQFRNWFYSLLAMSTVMEGREPTKVIFGHAQVRDERGEEMHKSKGNAIWFDEAAERMGVDAMRWLYCRQDPASNLNFGYRSADEVRRRFLIPLWNVYSFFVTYANIDHYDPRRPAPPPQERPQLDRWILSELHSLIGTVTQALEDFAPDRAARAVEEFVELLSNWYVRRSRRRFWKSEADEDKAAAYATLYNVLVTLTKLLGPFIPFMTESMYQNLVASLGDGRESVHLEDYPVADEALIDPRLSEAVRLAMRLSSLGRAARSKAGIKVRQPLQRVLVLLAEPHERALLDEVAHQVVDELNVKELATMDRETDVMEFSVRPNPALLGPKYGRDLPRVTEALASADPVAVAAQVRAGRPVEVDGFTLEPEEVVVETRDLPGYAAATDGRYTVAVATELTPELVAEGLAREVVHRIQNMRKAAGFDIADRIVTYYQGDPEVEAVMEGRADYIGQETLSTRLQRGQPEPGAYVETLNVNGHKVTVGVKRA